MSRLLFLLFLAFVSAINESNDEVTKILQRLNSTDTVEKVYKQADLIYAEFKASESLIDVDWSLFFKIFILRLLCGRSNPHSFCLGLFIFRRTKRKKKLAF